MNLIKPAGLSDMTSNITSLNPSNPAKQPIFNMSTKSFLLTYS